jgi:NADH-quinone oxidoreductase subunit E
MNEFPYFIEAALLLLAVFVAGCYVGSALRRAAPKPPAKKTSSVPLEPAASAAAIAPQAEADAPEPAPPAAQPASTPRSPRKKNVSEPAPPAESSPTPAKPAADPRPPALAAPRDGVKDDLKQIKGIGPRIEASLNEFGIFHFSQIARWTKKNVAWVDEQLSFRGRIEREKWIEQAKALAKR